METEQNCNILTPTLIATTAFLSRSPGLLNRRPGGPASLGHVPHFSIFFPTDWTSCAPSYIIVRHQPSQIALIQPVHGQSYILIFLDRMHMLFTPVHFLFWQLGWGQYVTLAFGWRDCRIHWLHLCRGIGAQIWSLNTRFKYMLVPGHPFLVGYYSPTKERPVRWGVMTIIARIGHVDSSSHTGWNFSNSQRK